MKAMMHQDAQTSWSGRRERALYNVEKKTSPVYEIKFYYKVLEESISLIR